jgi:hypothetical protein
METHIARTHTSLQTTDTNYTNNSRCNEGTLIKTSNQQHQQDNNIQKTPSTSWNVDTVQ